MENFKNVIVFFDFRKLKKKKKRGEWGLLNPENNFFVIEKK